MSQSQPHLSLNSTGAPTRHPLWIPEYKVSVSQAVLHAISRVVVLRMDPSRSFRSGYVITLSTIPGYLKSGYFMQERVGYVRRSDAKAAATSLRLLEAMWFMGIKLPDLSGPNQSYPLALVQDADRTRSGFLEWHLGKDPNDKYLVVDLPLTGEGKREIDMLRDLLKETLAKFEEVVGPISAGRARAERATKAKPKGAINEPLAIVSAESDGVWFSF